MAGGTG
jgi:hypothetical protein